MIHTNPSRACAAFTKTDSDQNQKRGQKKQTDIPLVKDWLADDPDLETLLVRISDGEFEVGALAKYDETDSLETACREAILILRQFQLVDRATCKQVMEAVNRALLARGVNPPRGWVPVLRRLRENAGPLRIAVPERKIVGAAPFKGHSAWTVLAREFPQLQEYEAIIAQAQCRLGIEADTWLDVLTVLNAISPLSEYLQIVHTEMQRRVGTVSAQAVQQ